MSTTPTGNAARTSSIDASGSKQRQIDIVNQFGDEHQLGSTYRPEPLYFYFVGKAPIHEALRGARPLGDGRAMDRACDLYLFPNTKLAEAPLDAVYYLDQETSTPLKVEYYLAGQDRTAAKPIRIWEAKTLDRIEGDRYFPLRSEGRFFTETPSGMAPAGTNTIIVDAIHYDREFGPKTFWPTYEPGVLVNDALKKTTARVPGPVATPKPALAAGSTGKTAEAARAVPPWSWDAAASPAALGLGALLIVVALALGRRRRR